MTTTVDTGRKETGSSSSAPPEQAPARHVALMAKAAKLRRGGKRSFPIETVLLVAGALLLPVGIIVIIVGWYGAAHTFHSYEQTDYLISGGLLGLGLVFVGGFLYFGYWMTRQIRTTSTANQQIVQALSRIEARLATTATNGNHPLPPMGAPAATLAPAKGRGSRSGSNPSSTRAEARPAQSTPGTPTGQQHSAPALVATEHGNLMHRPDCPVVANKETLRAVSPDEPGFRPCQICTPFEAP